MKKYSLLILSLALSVVLVACGDTNNTEHKEDIDGGKETEKKEKEKLNKKIDVNETLEFEQFNIEFKDVKAYEKDNKLLLDLNFSWRNKRLPDGSTLFVATLFEVVQNGAELEEINDHWNPEGDRSLQNDVFLNNTSGGLSPVKLTYELKDKENDVELIFTPTTETEESKTINVKLQ